LATRLLVCCATLNTGTAGNLGADGQKYSGRFERERAGPNAAQYSSRTQPTRERLGIENSDPYNAKPQYGMNSDRDNAGRTTTGVNINRRSDVLNQQSSKTTGHDRLAEFSSPRPVAGTMARDSLYPDNQRSPYSRTAADIFPSSHHRDPHTVGSGIGRQLGNSSSRAEISHGDDPCLPAGIGGESKRSALAGRGYNEHARGTNRERQHTSRQSPSSAAADRYSASPREVRPPPRPPPTYGSGRERSATAASSTDVGTAQYRVGGSDAGSAKKYASPAEEDLRRSLYDKRHQVRQNY